MSGKTRRTRERRHRRMEEARSEVQRIQAEMAQTTDPEQLEKLRQQYYHAAANATRSAHQL